MEGRSCAVERKREERKKGCGPGYALAANSCEGVSSVGACTVAAPDVITALAVQNPNRSAYITFLRADSIGQPCRQASNRLWFDTFQRWRNRRTHSSWEAEPSSNCQAPKPRSQANFCCTAAQRSSFLPERQELRHRCLLHCFLL